jgi:hypothetical protein
VRDPADAPRAAARRDAVAGPPESLLNIFVAGGGQLFESAAAADAAQVVLGQPSLLADQPEFASGDRMRRLLELTETRDELGAMLRQRGGASRASPSPSAPSTATRASTRSPWSRPSTTPAA